MIVPVCKNLNLLQGTQPTRFPFCNCLLIEDEIRTVIDTGLEMEVIKETNPEKVALVINSHGHGDHINGNRAFTQAKVAIHRLEVDTIISKEAFADGLVGYWADFMTVPLNFNIDFAYPGIGLTFDNSQIMRFPKSRVDFAFDEGDIIDLGEVKLTVVHIPGHTAGHSGFYWEREGILFSADIDLTRSGPWYGDKQSNLDQLIASVYRVRDLKPRLLIPGHGRFITEDLEQKTAVYLSHIFQREEKLLHYLSVPHTIKSLADKHLIYEDHTNPLFRYWEKVMLLKHLERLERKGVVKQSNGHYYI